MTIQRRLQAIILSAVALGLALTALFVAAQRWDAAAYARQQLVGRLAEQTFRLSLLYHELYLHPESLRALAQWRTIDTELERALRSTRRETAEEQAIIERLDETRARLGALVAQMPALTPPGPPQAQELAQERREHLNGQITFTLHAMVDDVLSLQYALRKGVASHHQNTNRFVIGVALLLTGIITLLAWLTGRNITQPIMQLRRGTAQVATGDLSYRVGTTALDEVGELSRDFDAMLERLQQVTTSRAELQRAERALRAASQYARSLIEASLDPLVTISTEGTITDVNEATAKATGVARETLIGSDFADYFTEPQKAREVYREVFEKGFVTDYPLAIRHTSGRVTEVLYNASLYRDPKGAVTGVFAAARDVTARNRAEEAQQEALAHLEQSLADLRAAQAQLVRSEKLAAVGTLAGGVAHEINNPLMGVMGYVDYARRSSSEPSVQKLLDGAKTGLERIRDLVKRLVAATTPLAWEWETLSLPIVLTQVLTALERDFKTCGIAVETALPADLPAVQATEEALRQVFASLLSNARDALTESRERKIRVSARRENDKVVIAVSDSGPGIPSDIQERIFDPFFTTKPPGQGTGLGLPIARNVVEALGGSITIHSEPGQGATFTVALPISRPPAD